LSFFYRGTPDRPNYFFNPDSASQSANASQVKMNAALLQASQDLPVDSALPQKRFVFPLEVNLNILKLHVFFNSFTCNSKIYRFPSTKVDLSSQTSEETQVQIMAALLEASQDLPETPVSEQKEFVIICLHNINLKLK
jgi:phage gp36-like protein